LLTVVRLALLADEGSNRNYAAHGTDGSIQFKRSGSVTNAAEPTIINIYSMSWPPADGGFD